MKSTVFVVFASALVFAHGGGSISSWQSFGGSEGSSPCVNVLASDMSYMVVEVSIPGFWLVEFPAGGSIWDRAEIPQSFPQGEIGLPDLPSVTELFALPEGTRAVVTVEAVNSVFYENMTMMPRQTPEVDMSHSPYPFVINENYYQGSQSYPSEWAYVDSEGGWAGLNVARLVVNPLRFNPGSGSLEAVSSVILRVEFEGVPTEITGPVNTFMVSAMEQNVLNWDDFREAALASGSRDAGIEYIFVCTDDNVDWVSELFETHHYLGLHTRVETLTAPATSSEVKAVITANYQSGVTRFVCLVGNYLDLASYHYGDYYGDYYYSLIDAGAYPDVAVGRITGDSADVVHQVDKTLSGYMDFDFSSLNTPGIIPSETLLAAHEENYPGKYTLCCNQVAAYSYGLCDISFTKVFPPEGGTKYDVINAINAGVGTVGYRGHGDWNCWQWSPGWSEADINNLTNTFMPPVFNIACLNGRYVYPSTCISEAWQWADGGASGNLGAASSSYTTPNHDYMKQIYLSIFNSGIFRVCEAIMASTVYVINHHGGLGLTNAEMYLWFGDPAMEIWTFDSAGQPGELDISHPANILPGNQDVTITVTDGGSPVEGVNVTLTDGVDNYGDGMTFYEEGTTNSSGQVTLNITAPSSGNVYIGAFLHNYRYDIKWVTIGTGIEGSQGETPVLNIENPYPNPITTAASLLFTIPAAGHVRISVYDAAGRMVDSILDGQVEGGAHSVEWNPQTSISGGVYFVRLDTENGSVTAQALLLR